MDISREVNIKFNEVISLMKYHLKHEISNSHPADG